MLNDYVKQTKMKRVIKPLLVKELCQRNMMQPHPSGLDLHADAAGLGVPQAYPQGAAVPLHIAILTRKDE